MKSLNDAASLNSDLQNVIFRDLGLISYRDAWDYQEKVFNELTERKLANRSLIRSDQDPQVHYLLFCEHPHVFTLGRSGEEKNLLADSLELNKIGAEFVKNNRGGDITYHGPGQIVGYPILDLDCFFTDIHKYLRYLEEAIIQVLAEYGIMASRFPGYTGVWIEPDNPQRARKICAMGVRCSRWVTMHGFALNVNSDLSYFEKIVPCGISGKAVTSMEKELGESPDINEVKAALIRHLAALFQMKIIKE
ncbi:MAG: lipoyl(octanoyl) transferase LipB [Bacteroidetes bacterium]|nr:MAG: lipoyl(octanoyl) transferase LipB [Bacteroidota bacterium]REK05775.1 MAG: lipoyl(octanoyl) transferase LipB [Bacteroidota bacterium]REK31919.1 MAG: lipoyl(octanoyl) transferase LipB [Bacteroidota bacterium]REK49984.1 MAG: lipoyl(octanoyl) transferase LipB [Bacteroidota bacterium]